MYVSIHAPLARSNATGKRPTREVMFQYMLLLRGATMGLRSNGSHGGGVSIHAPLARSNGALTGELFGKSVSIHAPLARSNCLSRWTRRRMRVSIHAPLARSNLGDHPEHVSGIVSIHAPLARSNCQFHIFSLSDIWFQYMLLLRGATLRRVTRRPKTLRFQYMLLLRGATPPRSRSSPPSCFNTCSSCEEQLSGRRTKPG